MTIATILATKGNEVVTLSADHKVADAVKLLAERRIGAVPVPISMISAKRRLAMPSSIARQPLVVS